MKLLTDKQKKLLYAKAREYGIDKDEFKDFLKKIGYESVKEIPGNEVDNVLNAMVDYVKSHNKKIGILFKVAKEHDLHIGDLKALIKEFGYASFGDIPDDKIDVILNAIPEYEKRKENEMLNKFMDKYK